MSQETVQIEVPRFVVHLRPHVDLTDDQLLDLCRRNPELRFERTADGELIIMPPVGGESGRRNSGLNALLWNWARRDGTGIAFDSSTGFVLPNGAMRSPDAAWVRRPRWDALGPAERERFLPLCPDFVTEVRSASDRLAEVQEKMREYLDNGAELGWLIDPYSRSVFVYRPGTEVEELRDPERVSGDPTLPGFLLDLGEVF